MHQSGAHTRPESAATVIPQLETLVSPRRVPRFVDEERAGGGRGRRYGGGGADGYGGGGGGGGAGAGADGGFPAAAPGVVGADTPAFDAALVDDRSIQQKNVDALVEIFALAGRAARSEVDHGTIYGDNTPGVRVLVTSKDAEKGVGPAIIEGQPATVSVATAERIICSSGAIPILFDKSRPIDVGKMNRLHSVKQRLAMAALWGGCPWMDCTRPPSMTEAHHCEKWNGSNTTLALGIPFCRFHHMLLHNNGWRVDVREDGTYWLVPPLTYDATRTPLQLRPKNPLIARL